MAEQEEQLLIQENLENKTKNNEPPIADQAEQLLIQENVPKSSDNRTKDFADVESEKAGSDGQSMLATEAPEKTCKRKPTLRSMMPKFVQDFLQITHGAIHQEGRRLDVRSQPIDIRVYTAEPTSVTAPRYTPVKPAKTGYLTWLILATALVFLALILIYVYIADSSKGSEYLKANPDDQTQYHPLLRSITTTAIKQHQSDKTVSISGTPSATFQGRAIASQTFLLPANSVVTQSSDASSIDITTIHNKDAIL